MVSIRLILTLAVIMVAFVISANAAYKKPPFNGSIFGKRSNTVTGKYKLCITFIVYLKKDLSFILKKSILKLTFNINR